RRGGRAAGADRQGAVGGAQGAALLAPGDGPARAAHRHAPGRLEDPRLAGPEEVRAVQPQGRPEGDDRPAPEGAEAVRGAAQGAGGAQRPGREGRPRLVEAAERRRRQAAEEDAEEGNAMKTRGWALALALVLAPAAGAAEARRPNVIFILADD